MTHKRFICNFLPSTQTTSWLNQILVWIIVATFTSSNKVILSTTHKIRNMLSRKINPMRCYSLLHSMKNHAKMKTRELTKQQTRLSLSSKQGRIHDRSMPSSSPTSLHVSFALNFFSIKEKINYHIVH